MGSISVSAHTHLAFPPKSTGSPAVLRFSDKWCVQIGLNVFHSFRGPLLTSQLPRKTYENNPLSYFSVKRALLSDSDVAVNYYLQQSISVWEETLYVLLEDR